MMRVQYHRAYQPLTPANNMVLRKRWDQTFYDAHRQKVAAGKNFIHFKEEFIFSILSRILINFNDKIKNKIISKRTDTLQICHIWLNLQLTETVDIHFRTF